MEFRSLSELSSYINKNQNGFNLANGDNLKRILQQEAQKLYDLIQDEIDAYYNSYTPTTYDRTYMFKDSLRVEPVQQNGNQFSVKIYFDENLVSRDSIMDSGDVGYLPILLNYGWTWAENPGIYHFSSYEGFHFIEKALNKYNSINRYGFKINIRAEYNGGIVDNRSY